MHQQCPVCRRQFAYTLVKPMITCNNQHLLCEDCLKSYYRSPTMICSQCRQIVDENAIRVNYHYYDLNFQLQMQIADHATDQQLIIQDNIGSYNKLLWFSKGIDREAIFNLILTNVKIFMRQNEYFIAKELLTRLILHNKTFTDPEYFLGLGSKEEQEGFSEGRGFSWYEDRFADKISPLDLLGICLLYNKDPDLIYQYESMSKACNKQNHKILYGQALVHHNAGRIYDACELYYKIIEIEPEFCKPYQMLAFIKNDPFERIQFAQKCLQRDQDNIFAEFIIAMAQDTGLKKTIRLNKILKKEPTYLRALCSIGAVRMNQGRCKEALQSYQRCIIQNKSFSSAYIKLGEAYLKQGKYAQGFSVLQSVIEMQNASQIKKSECYKLLGDRLVALEQEKEALEFYSKSRMLNPNNLETILMMQDIQYRLGYYKSVVFTCQDLIEDYNQFLDKDFKSVDAIQWLKSSKWQKAFRRTYDNLIYSHLWQRQYRQALDAILLPSRLKESLKIELNKPQWLQYSYYEEEGALLEWWGACIERGFMVEDAYDFSIEVLRGQRRFEDAIQKIDQDINRLMLLNQPVNQRIKLKKKLLRQLKVQNN